MAEYGNTVSDDRYPVDVDGEFAATATAADNKTILQALLTALDSVGLISDNTTQA